MTGPSLSREKLFFHSISWRGDSSTLHPQQRVDMQGMKTRNKMWHFSGGERVDCAIDVLSTSAILIPLNSFIDLLVPQFTDSCCVLHRQNFPGRTSYHRTLLRSPFSSLCRRGSMSPDMRQLPKQTATSDVQPHSVLSPYNRCLKLRHTMLLSTSPLFHDKFCGSLPSTIHRSL